MNVLLQAGGWKGLNEFSLPSLQLSLPIITGEIKQDVLKYNDQSEYEKEPLLNDFFETYGLSCYYFKH